MNMAIGIPTAAGAALSMARPQSALNQSRYDYAYATLDRLRHDLPSDLVFDIGAGDGSMERIGKLGLSWRGYDQTAWRRAGRWDLSEPYPDRERCGAALLLDVIEHCVNPGLALRNVSNAMMPGGRLILTVPNPRWSGSRVGTLLTGYASGFMPIDLDLNHHIFTPWPHILAKLLSDAGFSVEEYVTLDGRTNPFRQRLGMLYPLRVMSGFLRAVIELLDPSAIGMSYAFVATRRP